MELAKVSTVSEIPQGEMKKFDIDELEITIANVGGNLYAFEDRCPHMNVALHRGKLEGKEVVCPLHKSRFDVTTGSKTAEPRIPVPKAFKMGSLMANVRTRDLILYPVKVIDGDVWIEY